MCRVHVCLGVTCHCHYFSLCEILTVDNLGITPPHPLLPQDSQLAVYVAYTTLHRQADEGPHEMSGDEEPCEMAGDRKPKQMPGDEEKTKNCHKLQTLPHPPVSPQAAGPVLQR